MSTNIKKNKINVYNCCECGYADKDWYSNVLVIPKYNFLLLIPFVSDDHSRVCLAKKHSNYINANYIDVSMKSSNPWKNTKMTLYQIIETLFTYVYMLHALFVTYMHVP